MNIESLKDQSIRVLHDYWETEIGRDFDSGPSMPEWIEIRRIIQVIRNYDKESE